MSASATLHDLILSFLKNDFLYTKFVNTINYVINYYTLKMIMLHHNILNHSNLAQNLC